MTARAPPAVIGPLTSIVVRESEDSQTQAGRSSFDANNPFDGTYRSFLGNTRSLIQNFEMLIACFNSVVASNLLASKPLTVKP
jgi:hypothetical protein